MDIMEEGNLVDRVRILLQRNSSYYKDKKMIIQERICGNVVGGRLDFPKVTTFVAMKIVRWWEGLYRNVFQSPSQLFQDEYLGKTIMMDSIGNSMKLEEFAILVRQTSRNLLDHCHFLSQEALDHADISVLTGTVGTAALVKNALWIYNEKLERCENRPSLKKEYKIFRDMTEALAERLLDFHTRIISLYVLQDANCLDWDSKETFYEGCKSSHTVQMWWFYIQGIREDLWNTMPPKMAVRIFSGIVNESLTILSARYIRARPSKARGSLVIADISNILLCVRAMLPYICGNSRQFLGVRTRGILKNIHVKCHSLLCNLIVRATQLSHLHKIFKEGFSKKCFEKMKTDSPEPWVIFSETSLGGHVNIWNDGNEAKYNLTARTMVSYELATFKGTPRADFHRVLKILTADGCYIAREIIRRTWNEGEFGKGKCEGFLCNEDCDVRGSVFDSTILILIDAGSRIFLEESLLKVILERKSKDWSLYLNNSLLWNQARPIWMNPILNLIKPLIDEIAGKLFSEKETNTEIGMTYIKTAVSMADALPEGIFQFCRLLQAVLPEDITPVGNSVFIQFLAMALYDALGKDSAVANALWSIDAECLAPAKIEIQKITDMFVGNDVGIAYECDEYYDVLANKMLFRNPQRSAIKNVCSYVKNNTDWLDVKLGISGVDGEKGNILDKMFHIGNNPYDMVLKRDWIPMWTTFFQMPLGLTIPDITLHLKKRWEFDPKAKLTRKEQTFVDCFKNLFRKNV